MTTTEQRIVIEAAGEVTPEVHAGIARLVPQLSSSSPAPSAEDLAAIVADPLSTLFLARLASPEGSLGTVVGMLTLVAYRVPTGLHSVIEDVVVDEQARGAGAGAALVEAALTKAHQLGAKHVDLTSRASRAAANRLYQRMGFVPRETNIYRYTHR